MASTLPLFTRTECPTLSCRQLSLLNEFQYFINYDLRKMHIHNTITSLEMQYSPTIINNFFNIFDEYVYQHWNDNQLDEYEHYVDKFRFNHRIRGYGTQSTQQQTQQTPQRQSILSTNYLINTIIQRISARL